MTKIFNVTPIFWELINNINTMESYDELRETDSYKILKSYINEMEIYESQFLLYIDPDLPLYFETLESLFYDALRFYKLNRQNSIEYIMLEEALDKIEAFLTLENQVDEITNMLNDI